MCFNLRMAQNFSIIGQSPVTGLKLILASRLVNPCGNAAESPTLVCTVTNALSLVFSDSRT